MHYVNDGPHSMCACWPESFLTSWEVLVWETVIPCRPAGAPQYRPECCTRPVQRPLTAAPLDLAPSPHWGDVCPCMHQWRLHVLCCIGVCVVCLLLALCLYKDSRSCPSLSSRKPQLFLAAAHYRGFPSFFSGLRWRAEQGFITWWMLLSPN